MQYTRSRLRRLAGVMMRYTLSMSSDDCGGLSEYSEFFTALRECFGIPQTRAEIDDGTQVPREVCVCVCAEYRA